MYFARCMNIIFNSLLAQLVQYDIRKTRKMKSIHAISYHIIILFYFALYTLRYTYYYFMINIL